MPAAALLNISHTYKKRRLMFNFRKEPDIQGVQVQFSRIIDSTSEQLSSRCTLFRDFENISKFIKCVL